MGRRKITAAVLIIILLISLTACGRGSEEPLTIRFRKSGVRAYRYSVLPDGTFKKKRMTLEYEDLGTERTQKSLASDDSVITLKKWYYDDTGEHLLKEVSLEKYQLTESVEYDLQGRKIAHRLKNDMKIKAALIRFDFPDEYGDFLPEAVYKPDYLYRDDPASEMVTEYTYEGNTDRIKTIRTVTDLGCVIGSLECGEGDIVLSCHMIGYDYYISEPREYQETYDALTGQSQWTLYRDAELLSHGVRTYDDRGRCVSTETFDTEKNRTWRETYQYGDDGSYEQREEHMTARGEYLPTEIKQFDSKGKCISKKTYDYTSDPDMDTDEWILYRSKSYEYEYYDNGEVSRVSTKKYDGQGELTGENKRTYDARGRLTSDVTVSDGIMTQSDTMEIISVPGVAGDVMHQTRVKYNSREETYEREELYRLLLPDPDQPWEQLWMTYSLYDSTEIYSDRYHAEFDEQGRMQRIERKSYQFTEFFEYDEQGRLTRAGTIYNQQGRETGTLYEYWEEE